MHQNRGLSDPARAGNGDALPFAQEVKEVGDFPVAAEKEFRVGNRSAVIKGVTFRHIPIVARPADPPPPRTYEEVSVGWQPMLK
jgi:hypothetical protein